MATSSSDDTQPRLKKLFSRKSRDRTSKQSGRFRQIIDLFSMTRRHDPLIVLWMLIPLLAFPALGIGIGAYAFNWLTGLIVGLPLGVLGALFVLSRRAEKTAFTQIEGRPGAVGAVLGTLRRGWVVEEQPVAINPRTQEMVFRIVGRPGVLLITEGASVRARALGQNEKKRLGRILPNVPIHIVESGRGTGQVPLDKLLKTVRKTSKQLTKHEVAVVAQRLASLGNRLPVPQGIDPARMRPNRKAMRGR